MRFVWVLCLLGNYQPLTGERVPLGLNGGRKVRRVAVQ
jgi:hypothetical protein